MSWSRTVELLRAQLTLHRRNEDGFEDLTELPWFRAMHSREERYRPQVDGLCRQFIFTGAWPAMNKIQSHLVAYRLAWSIKLALGLETPFLASGQSTVSFPTHLEEAQVLHWLLIDTWNLAPKPRGHDPLVDDVIGVLSASQQMPRRRKK